MAKNTSYREMLVQLTSITKNEKVKFSSNLQNTHCFVLIALKSVIQMNEGHSYNQNS